MEETTTLREGMIVRTTKGPHTPTVNNAHLIHRKDGTGRITKVYTTIADVQHDEKENATYFLTELAPV